MGKCLRLTIHPCSSTAELELCHQAAGFGEELMCLAWPCTCVRMVGLASIGHPIRGTFEQTQCHGLVSLHVISLLHHDPKLICLSMDLGCSYIVHAIPLDGELHPSAMISV